MTTTLIVLMIIAAILLILVILIQNPKGGGLSSEFGGNTSQMFGVQKTGDILEQLTWGFFSFIAVAALVTSIFFGAGTGSTADERFDVETSQSAPATPSAAPAIPGTAPAETPAPATSPAGN